MIINAFKKTTTTSGMFFVVCFFVIDESSNASNGLVVFINQYPPVALAKAEKIIFFGIKYGFDVI